jgi:ribose 5-phosphate isomerase B
LTATGYDVITLGPQDSAEAPVPEILQAFLTARFSGEERHVRRLVKVRGIEAQFLRE